MSATTVLARSVTATTNAHSDYRAFLRTAAEPEWLEQAVDQIATWLRSKDSRLDIDLNADDTHTVVGKSISVRRHHKGGEDAFRFIMAEGEPGQQFVTTVMLVAGRTGGWMSLRVVSQSGAWVAPPRLAKNLLIAPGAFTDGGHQVSETLWHVRSPRDRAELLDLLVSDRRGPVFVAAAGPQDEDLAGSFARKVNEWTAGAAGLAHRVFLDAASADWLRTQVDGALNVAEWTVRTFRPGIDLAVPATLRLHRTMGMRALTETSEPRLRRLFSVFARQLLEDQAEEIEVGQWRRTFERLDSREAAAGLREVAERADTLRHRRTVQPAPGSPIATIATAPSDMPSRADVRSVVAQRDAALEERDQHLQTLGRIQSTLMLNDLSDSSLLELVDAATRSDRAASAGATRIDELEDQVAALEEKARIHHESEWAARQDAVDAQDQIAMLENSVRQLSRQLAGANPASGDDLSTSKPLDAPETAPGSWQDLVDRADEWRQFGVIITADLEIAADLHEIDGDGRCLSNAWRGLTALAGYLRSKREGAHTGGFWAYLDSQPIGYPQYNQSWFATSETKDAMKGAWGERARFSRSVVGL